MSEELKACPFCNSGDTDIHVDGHYFWGECQSCGATSKVFVFMGQDVNEIGVTKAREAWGHRPIEATLHTRITALEAQLSAEREARRWVRVEERLPEYGHAVLIKTQYSVVPKIGTHSPTIPQWASTDGMYYSGDKYSQVTHWMELPLPQPPQDGDV